MTYICRTQSFCQTESDWKSQTHSQMPETVASNYSRGLMSVLTTSITCIQAIKRQCQTLSQQYLHYYPQERFKQTQLEIYLQYSLQFSLILFKVTHLGIITCYVSNKWVCFALSQILAWAICNSTCYEMIIKVDCEITHIQPSVQRGAWCVCVIL